MEDLKEECKQQSARQERRPNDSRLKQAPVVTRWLLWDQGTQYVRVYVPESLRRQPEIGSRLQL
eukprot:4931089-Amphidinium_carterae.1